MNLIGVGAGYSYVVSGPTHQCYEDLSIMRALPNIDIYSPADHISATALFDQCIENMGPKYLRFDAQVLPVLYESFLPDMKNGFNVFRNGGNVCFVATGYMVHTALKVADQLASQGINIGVIDLFDISNFTADQLQMAINSYNGIVTMEEGFRGCGGMDAMMFEFVARRGLSARMLNIGVEGSYRFELGTRTDLHEQDGIGVQAVMKSVNEFMKTISA